MSKARGFKRGKGLDPEDFYHDDKGLIIYTAQYHTKRGYCCKNACKHCPYGFEKKKFGDL